MNVLTTPTQIELYRLYVLRSALRLECKGFRRRGVSVCNVVKREFGFAGDKHSVLEQLEQHIREKEGGS